MAEPVRLSPDDLDWLVALLAVPSVSPLEGGDPAEVDQAQRVVEQGAATRGFRRARRDSPPASILDRPDVPMLLRQAAAAAPSAFLTSQPSLVMRLGRPQPRQRRLVLNFHVDTVGPYVAPRLAAATLHGRGSVDDKGPGVAAAVGAAAAWAAAPWLAQAIEVLLVSVPGEEGGAMGAYGTRWLVESGCIGRLCLFAEPTGGRVLDACSATMTPRLRIDGVGATDDHPESGHNATLALGWLASYLGRELGRRLQGLDAKVCVAGLHTGTAHNRVYGSGELLLNIAYYDRSTATRLAAEVEQLVAAAEARFAAEFGDCPLTQRLVADWPRVVRVDWLKKGLPPLRNRDPDMERLLAGCGLPRHDGIADGTTFTCDAIWAGGPGRYVAVCGPGQLDANRAHTPDEHVHLEALDRYATQVRDLVLAFGAHATGQAEQEAGGQ